MWARFKLESWKGLRPRYRMRVVVTVSQWFGAVRKRKRISRPNVRLIRIVFVNILIGPERMSGERRLVFKYLTHAKLIYAALAVRSISKYRNAKKPRKLVPLSTAMRIANIIDATSPSNGDEGVWGLRRDMTEAYVFGMSGPYVSAAAWRQGVPKSASTTVSFLDNGGLAPATNANPPLARPS